MICVVLTGRTTDEMLRDAHLAAALGADMVEFRVDYCASWDVAPLIAHAPLPEIITCRAKRDGGLFEGDESARVELLQQAVDLGADYVDVELDSVAKIHPEWPTKLIVSVHDFERTPDDLPRLHAKIAATGADVVKIATTAVDVRDNLRLFELLDAVAEPTIALAMGERGVISRILAPKFGGWLTYASLAPTSGSAPGQLTIADLLDLYRYRHINSDTELFGVIAKPVAHSMSPLIHNTAFARLRMNRLYLPFLVDDVTDFIARFRRLPVKGFSVTLPHKERALGAADEVDPLTRRIGAVNTLVEREGRLVGTNTDRSAAVGAMEAALRKADRQECLSYPPGGVSPGSSHGGTGIPACPEGGVSPLAGKRVALIGARGTARAICVGLVDAGAEVKIFNRTVERARALAGEFGCDWASLDDIASARDADVLVNTTPIGMFPNVDESVVPADVLRKGMLVFDAVYNPVETKLIREARSRGCLTVTGLEMFVAQAAEQFRLFTGEEPPVDIMRDVVVRRLAAKDQ